MFRGLELTDWLLVGDGEMAKKMQTTIEGLGLLEGGDIMKEPARKSKLPACKGGSDLGLKFEGI